MTKPHISDLQLELLALDALSAKEAKALREALENDSEARARYDAIVQSNEELLSEFPPDHVNAEVARRVKILESQEGQIGSKGEHSRVLRSPMFWAPVAASVAMLLLVVLPFGEDTPGFRVKGEAHLVVHRISGDSAEQLADGDFAREGDRIQLSVAPAGRRYAVVVSLDGNGQVTLHFPRRGGDGKIVTTDAPFSLPTSYLLDDAPAFERFFLITALTPLDPKGILDGAGKLTEHPNRLRSATIEDLPEGARQSSFLLRKAK